MNLFQAILLAIIEGITEFLPVSSTGHMIIGASLMGIADQPFTKAFEVNIQFGAILSVVVLYWRKFLQSFDFYLKLAAAFLPAAVIGFLANDFIDSLLENVNVVATMLILGGFVLLFIDKYFEGKTIDNKQISYFDAIKIGLFQCIAMIPGVSRSAATIIGGMFQGVDRKNAAEFSFFLAVPTMLAASGYKLLKGFKSGTLNFTDNEITLLAVGNIVGFVVAMLAIKTFIGLLTKYGFKFFGYYRIIVGVLILALSAMGVKFEII